MTHYLILGHPVDTQNHLAPGKSASPETAADLSAQAEQSATRTSPAIRSPRRET